MLPLLFMAVGGMVAGGALALAQRRRWGWAALLGVLSALCIANAVARL